MHGFILVIYRRKEPCYSKIILGIWEKCTHCVKLCQDVYLMSCANCTQTRPEEIDLLGFFYVVGSFYKKTKKKTKNKNKQTNKQAETIINFIVYNMDLPVFCT